MPYIKAIALLLLACVLDLPVFAQSLSQAGDAAARHKAEFGYEVHSIRFHGNSYFPDDVLAGVIRSQATDLSTPDIILNYYADGVFGNPYAPEVLKERFVDIKKEIDIERQYYDRLLVEADVQSLKLFYTNNGFHTANIVANFISDEQSGKNVLTFTILENALARIDTLVYIGLDGLPESVRTKVDAEKSIQMNSPFQSASLDAQNARIAAVLRDEGYFFTRHGRPIVSYNKDNNTDSITVHFATGLRQKIAHIEFVDSTSGQRGVSQNTRQRQLEFSKGDWFSASKIDQSMDNIYSLGAYEVVSIDTVHKPGFHSDSTLALRIFTRMRKTQELSGNILMNKNINDNFWNAGGEVYYQNRNIFGAAQNLQVYLRALLINVDRQIDRGIFSSEVDREFQIGFDFTQPFLTRIFRQRLGLGWQLQASTRQIPIEQNSFDLVTLESQIYLPLTLPRHTFINTITLSLDLQSEQPQDFDASLSSFLEDAATPEDSLSIINQLFQYALLATAVDVQGKFLTKSAIGVTLTGDKRNHPFNPTRGNYVFTSVDCGGALALGGLFPALKGSAGYIRFNGILQGYKALSRKAVLAGRLRAGHFFWEDVDNENSFLPLEDLFFAGGGNSLRAWRSRDVRTEPIAPGASQEIREFADLIGSGTVLEASVEVRLKLGTPGRTSSFWLDQFNRLGLTFFTDIGNTHNSLIQSDSKTSYDNNPLSAFGAILEEPAVGIGLGLRYDLPVGPLRIDVASRFFDPLIPEKNWIWERPFAVRWQIGIGHAF